MKKALAIAKVTSFMFAVWVLAFAYGLFDSSIRTTWFDGFLWVAALISIGCVVATRGYHLWKWSLPGPSIGSLLLAVGHIGLVVAYLISEEMRHAGQGSGLLLVLPALWCAGLYIPGVIAIVVSLLKEIKRSLPPANAA